MSESQLSQALGNSVVRREYANVATDTDDLDVEEVHAVPNDNKKTGIKCVSCENYKKELHTLRTKNMALRDDCRQLRSSLNLVKKSKSELGAMLEDAKAKADQHFREFIDWEALSKKQEAKLSKTKASLKRFK